MKKFLKSKGFLVTALSISCIAILAVCWFVGRDTKTAFLPDEPSPDAVQEEWTDTPDTAGSSWEHADSGIPSQSSTEEKLEDYPKVAEESEQEAFIIRFCFSSGSVKNFPFIEPPCICFLSIVFSAVLVPVW